MKNILVLITTFFLFSCDYFNTGVEVEIVNVSEKSIKNIKLYTSENKEVLTFGELKSGEKITDFLNMEENKIDGHYILEFITEDGEIKKTIAGYYSNGKSLDQKIIFEIENDIIKLNKA